MPTRRESNDRYTADSLDPATVMGDSRRSTRRYSSTVPSAPSKLPLTQEQLQRQARLLEAQRQREYEKWGREQSQRTVVPAQRQSNQSTHRPSQQSTSTLYAPLTSVLPPKPTVEDLMSRGFTYAYSTRKPAEDYYERYSTATRDGKLVQVYDTVGIPSQRR
jgi:hypothetical protein